MVMLLQNFIASLTVVLPFYPVGTMERVVKEGQVATANTYAQVHTHIHIRPPSRLCAVWVVGRSVVGALLGCGEAHRRSHPHTRAITRLTSTTACIHNPSPSRHEQMFSNLPSCGRPTRLLIYDLHTLQVRTDLNQHDRSID